MSLSSKHLRPSRGFTLIELMITVAVIAILAGLAIPSYLVYVKRSKLPPAFSQLSAYAIALQQYYQDNRTYVGYQEPLPSGVGLDCKNGTDYTPANSNFKYTCSSATASAFKVTATGISGTAADSFVFSITNDNTQSTDGAPTGWTKKTTCWIRDPSGSCN